MQDRLLSIFFESDYEFSKREVQAKVQLTLQDLESV